MRVIVAVTSQVPGVSHCGGWGGVVEALEWGSWGRHIPGEVPQGVGQAGRCISDGAPSTWGSGTWSKEGRVARGLRAQAVRVGTATVWVRITTERSWGKHPQRRAELKQDPKLSGWRKEAAWQRCKGESCRTAGASEGPCKLEGLWAGLLWALKKSDVVGDWCPLLPIDHIDHLKQFLEMFLVLCQHCKSLLPSKGNALASHYSISRKHV